MSATCGFFCDNKTEDGYCKTTTCINPLYQNSTNISYINYPYFEDSYTVADNYDISCKGCKRYKESRRSILSIPDKCYRCVRFEYLEDLYEEEDYE